MGTIELQVNVKGRLTTMHLKNVMYVPGMGNTTLISLGKLDDKGYKFTSDAGATTCYDNSGRA